MKMSNRIPNISQMCICFVEGGASSNKMLHMLFETLGRFCKGRGNLSTIQCLQKKSSTCYIVVLRNSTLCQSLLKRSPFLSKGQRVYVLPMSPGNVVIVTVKGILPSIPLNAVVTQLLPYGRVINAWKECYQNFSDIDTGNIKIRIALERDIPSYIYVWGQRGKVFFSPQRKLCWRCGSRFHLFAQCNNITCTLCGKVGHFSYKCSLLNKNPSSPYYYHNRNKFKQFYNDFRLQRTSPDIHSQHQNDITFHLSTNNYVNHSGQKRLIDSDVPKNFGEMDWVSEDSGIIEDNLKEIEKAFSELGISYLHHRNKKFKYDFY